ncbi:DUF2252 domain-containing protein [Lysinibacillus sp. LZ02]|uniref:DUF2252 domain-containing protein n=1 Tax=Lysinibacillus sp. LZ02 TaxID=3420668 RepID=UPI003D35A3F6
MEEALLSRVRNTRVALREQQIATIFDEFDEQCMQLTDEQRVEKYKKMLESPFRFYRGSAYLFYYDVTKTPSIFHSLETKPTWIMGDMHMDNFGAFQNEKGEIVYDVNDFDEGYVGSYLYDLIRMSVSIGLYMDEQQMEEAAQEQVIQSFLNSYINQLKRFQLKKEDAFTLNFTKANTKGPIKKLLKKLEKRKSTHLLEDITEVKDGKRVFVWGEEVQPVSPEMFAAIKDVLPQYEIKDIALKYGSGTASIGLKRFYILVEGQKDASGEEDLVLEMKEVRTAIPAYFMRYSERFWSAFEHQGARVVGTQKAMHHLEDPHLTYITMDGQEYYVRERSPYKKKVKPRHYKSLDDYIVTAEIMGKIAAKIHARADIDYSDVFTYHSEDEILERISQHHELFVQSTVLQAMHYKKMVYIDYDLFKEWAEQKYSELQYDELSKEVKNEQA